MPGPSPNGWPSLSRATRSAELHASPHLSRRQSIPLHQSPIREELKNWPTDCTTSAMAAERSRNPTHIDAQHTAKHLDRKTYDAMHQVTFLSACSSFMCMRLLIRRDRCDQPVCIVTRARHGSDVASTPTTSHSRTRSHLAGVPAPTQHDMQGRPT